MEAVREPTASAAKQPFEAFAFATSKIVETAKASRSDCSGDVAWHSRANFEDNETVFRIDASGYGPPRFWLRRQRHFGYDTYGLRIRNKKDLHHF